MEEMVPIWLSHVAKLRHHSRRQEVRQGYRVARFKLTAMPGESGQVPLIKRRQAGTHRCSAKGIRDAFDEPTRLHNYSIHQQQDR
ncbi:MAG: hypothetical protein ACJA00_005241 [Myxococcota bacterium]|jgi:hypothetical protein